MLSVSSLHLCIFLGPLAVYFLLLGALNLSRRPFLTTGTRDGATLGIAIAGFVLAGPMDLFLPEAAAITFGEYVWLIMIALYALGLALVVLLMRPRLIVYNITTDQLRPILAAAASELDKQVRWAGDCLVLPSLGVQLTVEPSAGLRCSQLVAAGPRQSYPGWRRLETALNRALKENRVQPNPYGWALVVMGLAMAVSISLFLINNPQAVAEQLQDLLRQ